MNALVQLRQYLHRHPELSNREYATSEKISDILKELGPEEEILLGSNGRAFVFNGKTEGPMTMFRAELDALPIPETGGKPYSSSNPGVSHVCGHDGHMTILVGLAQRISARPPDRGKVVLLFQPAEEMEQGARDVVEDPRFKMIEPDYVFALHQIPGEPMHRVLIKEDSFASASRGLTVRLTGRTSHAGEPDQGISPARAVSAIIETVEKLNQSRGLFSEFTFATLIYIRLGEISFGTSPGEATMGITLRSVNNSDMESLIGKLEERISEISAKEGLIHEISYSEIFPATVNDPVCVELIRKASRKADLPVKEIEHPFRWSEDFGYFTEKFRGGYFGLGSGEDTPPLHHPGFDFPDELIDSGVSVFYSIYSSLHLEQESDGSNS